MNRLQPRTSIEYADGKVRFIDQRLLPGRYKVVETGNWRVVAEAIKTLAIRGAPLIGVAAALGVAAQARPLAGSPDIRKRLEIAIEGLRSTRPTAVNLFRALERMRHAIKIAPDDQIVAAAEREALDILEDDKRRCDAIGQAGLEVVPGNARILTICNTGFLATAGIGTALGVIYKAKDTGKLREVFALETRPLLQGARLTAWELKQSDIPVTLLPDGASGSLLLRRGIDLVIIGADRIAVNGDTANKIGSLPLALAAARFGVPLFVAAPGTTFDPKTADGYAIPIEERPAEEVREIDGNKITPAGVGVYNPAFDIVDSDLIAGFITDKGIFEPPYNFDKEHIINRAGTGSGHARDEGN